ncbi:16862_t:CDS:2, partial [Cetraspora pellucida]
MSWKHMDLSKYMIAGAAFGGPIGLNEPPHNWTLIPPQYTLSSHVEVLIATSSTILTVDFLQQLLLMVGPYGDWIRYPYDDAVFLIPEIDGVRIISSDKCEFLQKVPNVTEETFKIGSTAPAAMLFDALEHFDKRSPKADENIRSIRPELSEAVDACIEAAGHEFNQVRQRSLLKAAAVGKTFLEPYNSDRFVEMCQILRVLNSIKKPTDDEETICRMIVEKLANKPSLSYAEIAKTPHNVGQPKLATRLLDYEPRAADQVPLLISMQKDELALIKAIESGDTDLVMLHLKRKLPLPEFFRIINNKPMACSLLEVYCKQQDLKLLNDFYYQDSFEAKAIDENIKLLQSQAQLEKDMNQKFVGLPLNET